MASLCAYMDDSGTGMDQPHFLLGGVAVVQEACSKPLRDEAATFDRKAGEWDGSEFIRCATLLSHPSIYPFAAWIRPVSSIVSSAKQRVRDARDEVRRSGRLLLKKHRLQAPTQIYMSVAATAFAACVVAPTMSGQPVDSVRVVADRITMQAEHRDILRNALQGQTAAVIAASARLGVHAANARWGNPVVEWRSGGPFLTLADAYCHIVRRALVSDPDAEYAMQHIRTTLRYQGRTAALASLCIDDTERVRAQMYRSFVPKRPKGR